MVDVAKIEQVLRNLLENAVRYSPDGGDIVIELVRNAEMWELRVSDQGIGIAAEEQGQIFERFYRSRDARVRRIRGAGLGLAICREIVRAHSGVLSLISALDQGATFVVSLPCTAPPTHDLALGDPAFVASERGVAAWTFSQSKFWSLRTSLSIAS
jgi:signal transduction histidine kinase